jgi:hypothetical protein
MGKKTKQIPDRKCVWLINNHPNPGKNSDLYNKLLFDDAWRYPEITHIM